MEGLALEVWKKKYRQEGEASVEDMWRRTAKAIASVEVDKEYWEEKFYELQKDFKFIAGGRINAGAGTANNYLLNCAVIPIGDDSINSIYEAVKHSAVLAKCNYGVGIDFSPIRPKNTKVSKGGTASGPVSFMKVFDSSGAIIETGGGRRAAAIGILRVDHPDIMEFMEAKRETGVLTQFNISVAITEKFLSAVRSDSDFDLVFGGEVHSTIKAKAIWDKLLDSAYNFNDPGVLMIDEINKYNNGWYLYDIAGSNPCGEIPLPEWGVCCLGSINVTKFVKEPFAVVSDWTTNFDWEAYAASIKTATRFLDNVLDVSDYPYQEMTDRARGDRRTGMCSVAGIGSALAMLRVPYDSEKGLEVAEYLQMQSTQLMYAASIELAQEKGAFPNFSKHDYLEGNFISKCLNTEVYDAIVKYGIRNIAINNVPPVGTGSLIAGNISNGLEPIFACEYNRNVRQTDGSTKSEPVEDYAWKLWKKTPEYEEGVFPEFFKTAREISPESHVAMQAVLQKWIDGSISKTANIPEHYSREDYEKLFWKAIDSGCKGFTTFRENTREGVLETKKDMQKKQPEAPIKIKAAEPKKKRSRVLSGKTYKIKDNKGNLYVTINDIEENGKVRPFEIFISANGENVDYNEFYQLTAKNWSAIMRRVKSPDELRFLIDDADSIYSPSGYFSDGKYMRSKPQMLGCILEEHIQALTGESKKETLAKCPECGELSYSREGGCGSCKSCGYAQCG